MGFELTGQLVWAVQTATNIFDRCIGIKLNFVFVF
jgi:hypothetical protein